MKHFCHQKSDRNCFWLFEAGGSLSVLAYPFYASFGQVFQDILIFKEFLIWVGMAMGLLFVPLACFSLFVPDRLWQGRVSGVLTEDLLWEEKSRS